MIRPAIRLIPLLAAALTLSCAGKSPKNSGSRNSGQSRLMDQTFAGQNACNPDNHMRPFIIEWDATDSSSFQAHAENDIVMVKYEGCNLRVLDECKNESLRGEQGSYLPPTWTQGALETIDIHNEGELVAKLPLGVATLGGRVAGGESFHMEYYVAGTRNATRDSVYKADLGGNPACEEATHFVYAYNLGAFALGSATDLEVGVSGSAYGFGAETNLSQSKSAEKKGGDLNICSSDSATEIQGCAAPIRLSLREIRDGENPSEEAKAAPDTEASLNAAGQLAAKMDMSDDARKHFEAAQRKAGAGDGKGCIKELDAHGKLDPDHASTKPDSYFSAIRSQCLMLAGKCDAGKQLLRKYYEKQGMANQWGPEQVDRSVEGMASMYCQGKMKPRDALLKASTELSKGANMTKKSPAFCKKQFDTIAANRKKVKPKGDNDFQITSLDNNTQSNAARCFAKAGDCKSAFKAYETAAKWMIEKGEGLGDRDYYLDAGKDRKATIILTNFNSAIKECAGKVARTNRDKLTWAISELRRGGGERNVKASFCDKHFKTIEKLRKKVKVSDDKDHEIKNLPSGTQYSAAQCFEKAKDCKKAFAAFKKANSWNTDPKRRQADDVLRRVFDGKYKSCAKK